MFVRNRYSRFEKVVLGFRSIPSTIAMASPSNCEQNMCVLDVLCERCADDKPVSFDLEPSLRHRNTDIENWRPETHAGNRSIAVQNSEN
jgi:hypothetical protein